MGLISDLKERRLFQIVAAYAAAGFVLLQIVDQLIQNDMLPAFVYPLTVWWYVVGFIAAIMVGWFHGEKGAQKAPLIEIVVIAILAVGLLGLSGFQVSRYLAEGEVRAAAAASELDLRRIAVTYFEDVGGDGESQYLADAFTEELIQELSTIRALDVVSRNAVAPYRVSGVSVDSIARTLRAGTVVSGTVEEDRGRVRVNIRIHDGLSGTEFRRTTLEQSADELLTTRDAVIEETAGFLREWLGEEITVRRRQRAVTDVSSWALLQRAERERKEGERLLAVEGIEAAFAAFDRADELLERTEVAEPGWTEPTVLRAEIAYRRSRVSFPPPEAAEPWIRVGLEHADRALARESAHPRALEMRGTLNYWRYLLPLIPDPQERNRVLAAARADLEQAVRVDPTLATAHATLSHLYAWIDEMSSSVLAARRAYEEDAYLETAGEVLWRLTTGLYDLESFEDADRWCRVGAGRFDHDHRFFQCQILMMTTRAAEPDIDRAWALVDRGNEVLPEADRQLQNAVSLTYVGGVLARANLPDSSDTVLRQARDLFRPELDPHRELYKLEAAMRASALQDPEEAIELLKLYAVQNPGYDFSHHWWWRSVRNHPRYVELTAFQADH